MGSKISTNEPPTFASSSISLQKSPGRLPSQPELSASSSAVDHEGEPLFGGGGTEAPGSVLAVLGTLPSPKQNQGLALVNTQGSSKRKGSESSKLPYYAIGDSSAEHEDCTTRTSTSRILSPLKQIIRKTSTTGTFLAWRKSRPGKNKNQSYRFTDAATCEDGSQGTTLSAMPRDNMEMSPGSVRPDTVNPSIGSNETRNGTGSFEESTRSKPQNVPSCPSGGSSDPQDARPRNCARKFSHPCTSKQERNHLEHHQKKRRASDPPFGAAGGDGDVLDTDDIVNTLPRLIPEATGANDLISSKCTSSNRNITPRNNEHLQDPFNDVNRDMASASIEDLSSTGNQKSGRGSSNLSPFLTPFAYLRGFLTSENPHQGQQGASRPPRGVAVPHRAPSHHIPMQHAPPLVNSRIISPPALARPPERHRQELHQNMQHLQEMNICRMAQQQQQKASLEHHQQNRHMATTNGNHLHRQQQTQTLLPAHSPMITSVSGPIIFRRGPNIGSAGSCTGVMFGASPARLNTAENVASNMEGRKVVSSVGEEEDKSCRTKTMACILGVEPRIDRMVISHRESKDISAIKNMIPATSSPSDYEALASGSVVQPRESGETHHASSRKMTSARRGRQSRKLGKSSRVPKSSNRNMDGSTGNLTQHGRERKKHRAAQQASLPTEGSLKRRADVPAKVRDIQTRDSSPPPVVRYSYGTKVTMIDEERKVFVIDLLPPETCELVRRMAHNHVANIERSGSGAPTWRTLYTYTKMDLPCSEVPGLAKRITDVIMADIKKVVGDIFRNKKEAAKLRPRSWKEPHLLLYQKVDDKPHHTGVEMHYDGCDITWQAMLTRVDEYEGGGTYFRCLRKTVKLHQGQVLVHPGELYHKGVDITSGVRALIVGFMDGFDPGIIDESQQSDDKEEYESNVRMY